LDAAQGEKVGKEGEKECQDLSGPFIGAVRVFLLTREPIKGPDTFVFSRAAPKMGVQLFSGKKRFFEN
jgi:hypothetical protein